MPQLLDWAAYLVTQSGAQALADHDAAGMARAARVAINLARVNIATGSELSRIAEHPPYFDKTLAMLAALITDDPEDRLVALPDAGMPTDTFESPF